MEFRDYDTRLAAYAVVVDDQDRVLLALWNEREPQWTLPGGGVDLHEDAGADP
jgi:8-oxo-dGTP diphosphatase